VVSVSGLEGEAIKKGEFHMMAYHDLQQQGMFQNPQYPSWINPQMAQTYSPGQAAYGQQFGQPNIGAWGLGAGWGQQRQLPYEVGDVVRQLVPLLPQLLVQAQQQPQAAFGIGQGSGFGQGYGQPYGQFPRQLTQQDVNEVVRQLLPILPQIIGTLQGQGPHTAAMYGGWGQPTGQQFPFGHFGNPFQQQWFGQQGWPQHQQGWPQQMAAFGSPQQWGTRHLTQQDVSEVARQLVGIIPQVIANLQAYGQQRVN
jgi:hypothetical protein